MAVYMTSSVIFIFTVSPVFAVVIFITILLLCAGKKKEIEYENGVLSSSGSYSKKPEDIAGKTIVNSNSVAMDVSVEKQQHMLVKSEDVVVQVMPPDETDGRVSRSLQRRSEDVPSRPREPSPRPAQSQQNNNQENELSNISNTSVVIENSGSEEVSSDGLYAKVLNVKKPELEIAYSVVELKNREQQYELVNNEVKRKLSVDADKSLANDSNPYDTAHYTTVPKGETMKKKELLPPTSMSPTANLYAQVNVTHHVSERQSYEVDGVVMEPEDSGGSGLYATVADAPKCPAPMTLEKNSGAPKHSSLPGASKGGLPKLSLFKQSKRRSRTVDDTATSNGDSKGNEKKTNKKKHDGRRKSETDEQKGGAPDTPPPPPPVEILKTIAKEINKRKSIPEDGTVNTARSSSSTPSGSPGLGELPKIPVSQNKYLDDFDDDDLYERVSNTIEKEATTLSTVNTKAENVENLNKGNRTAFPFPPKKPSSVVIEVDKNSKTGNELLTTDGGNIEVAAMYAQVDKPRQVKVEQRTPEKSNNTLHVSRHQVRSDTTDVPSTVVIVGVGPSPSAADDKSVSELYTEVNKKKNRSKSEAVVTTSPVKKNPLPTPLKSGTKKRAQTLPEGGDMYAQVDLEKKRQSRKVGETYAQVDKPKTGTKRYHQTCEDMEPVNEMLYEGSYNIIPDNTNGLPGVHASGYMSSRAKDVDVSGQQKQQQSNSHMGRNMDYDHDDETYETVNDL